jgi:hypothetical protein
MPKQVIPHHDELALEGAVVEGAVEQLGPEGHLLRLAERHLVLQHQLVDLTTVRQHVPLALPRGDGMMRTMVRMMMVITMVIKSMTLKRTRS